MEKDLQAENSSLRRRLDTLLTEARLNEEKMRRFDLLERQLIAADTLAELVRLLLAEYKTAFGVECVTLYLVDCEYEAARILETDKTAQMSGLMLTPDAAPLEALYQGDWRPRLEKFSFSLHGNLFGHHEEVASVALLPLVRHEKLIGSLHFGSRDPERYDSVSGTQFLERLAAVVSVCIESAQNQERLKQIGLTDSLTGVQNRRYFEHRCAVEISQARRHRQPLSCMFLDIDRFKSINDTHGHQTGDAVLQTVALIIRSQLRAADTLARYGGEEFVALLPQASASHAREIAERIRARIAHEHFRTASGHPFSVTISIGLSMLPADEDGNDSARMISAADQALYRAKRGGRNRVESELEKSEPSSFASLTMQAAAASQRFLRLMTAAARKSLP